MIFKLGVSKLLKCPPTGTLLNCFRNQLINYYVGNVGNISCKTGLRALFDVKKISLVAPVDLHINFISKRYNSSEKTLNKIKFESVCSETLESLTEYFEELVETEPRFKNADVSYSDGVLTVHLGSSYGTYVINRQSPNLQIWLSSPTSGPKRYDFINGTWVYKHDRTTLHSLLDKEIKTIVEKEVEFTRRCAYSKKKDS